jgi:hypothetical protein
MKNTLMVAIAFGFLSATPNLAQTQTSQPTGGSFDSRWNPYLGCWRVAQEQQGGQTLPSVAAMMVCVRPSGPSGVTMTTTVDGKTVLEQTIVADGSPQPLSQENCQGTQTSQWSRDGERLFTRVEMTCAGRPQQIVSGITQLARGYWIDAQATVIDGDHDVRLRRYQRTSDQYTGGSVGSSAPMNVEDVIEASSKVLSPALEAALVESGGRFTLNSRTLKQLADARVSPNVIDLMVAQAYPERFQIERPDAYQPLANITSGGTTSSSNTTVIMGSAAYPYPIYDPFYSSYYYYSPFAYPYYWGSSYFPYRYGRYYGSGNYFNNYYYNYPGSIYYGSGGSGSRGTAQPGSPDHRGSDGVMIKGRGYTRVRPSSESGESGGSASAPTQRSSPSSRGVRSVNSGSDSSSSSSSGSSGGSSSGGSSSGGNSGSSGGGNSGGGGGGGRTAQPR